MLHLFVKLITLNLLREKIHLPEFESIILFQLVNFPNYQVAPNPSYTEYMIERVKLEDNQESNPYHQSKSPLFLSSLASNALQTR